MNKTARYNFLIFASAFVWVMMMGSKNVYTAEYMVISNIFDVLPSQANLAMTFYFITYSTAQVVLFFFMEKLNLKSFMLISIFLSGLVTVVVAFATGMWQLWWILSINGILQAGVWGICTAVFDKHLPINMKPKANLVMNIGTAIAYAIAYGSGAFFTAFATWNLPFIILGIILSISAIVYYIAVKMCEKISSDNSFNTATIVEKQSSSLPFTLQTSKRRMWFYIITFILSLLIHSLYYTAQNLLPGFLQENFNQNESVAMLISTLAPLATTIGPIFAIRHCEKHRNFINVGLIYMAIALAISFFYIFLFDRNMILSLVMLITYLIIIQGVVTIVFSVISYKLSEYINAGAHSGLMNSAGGYACGFAPFLTLLIKEATSWQFLYTVVFFLGLFITIMIIIISITTKKQKA